MKIITRETKAGTLYINAESSKMVLKQEEKTIGNQNEIYDILESYRIPIKADFEITGKCNLNCYYCMAKSLTHKKELDVEKVKSIIDEIDKSGVAFLEITGGEPLIHQDFLEIIKYLQTKDMIVYLLSNITMINQQLIDELKKINLAKIQTSLLSPIEDECDRLTGVKGSYRKIIDAMLLLKKNDMPVGAKIALTNQNVHLYDAYEELSNRLGIKFEYMHDVKPTYESFNNTQKYKIEERLNDYITKHINKETACKLSQARCGAGKSQFAIDVEGNLMTCSQHRPILGNLLDNDFESLWNSPELLDTIENKFKRDEQCKDCKHYDYCFWCPGLNLRYCGEHQKCSSPVYEKAKYFYDIYN